MGGEDLTHLIGDDYETMDGRPAKVIAIIDNEKFPVVVVYKTSEGAEGLHLLTSGLELYTGDHSGPFIRRKPKRETREIWLNMYHGFIGDVCNSREEADRRQSDGDRIACVKVSVTFEHGEGI